MIAEKDEQDAEAQAAHDREQRIREERRYLAFLLPYCEMIGLIGYLTGCTKYARPVFYEMGDQCVPEGAFVAHVHNDYMRQAFVVIFGHESFPHQPPGSEIMTSSQFLRFRLPEGDAAEGDLDIDRQQSAG